MVRWGGGIGGRGRSSQVPMERRRSSNPACLHPFNTGYLLLRYSGNLGVKGVSYRGSTGNAGRRAVSTGELFGRPYANATAVLSRRKHSIVRRPSADVRPRWRQMSQWLRRALHEPGLWPWPQVWQWLLQVWQWLLSPAPVQLYYSFRTQINTSWQHQNLVTH
jgi:hypothetical protein